MVWTPVPMWWWHNLHAFSWASFQLVQAICQAISHSSVNTGLLGKSGVSICP